MKQEFLQLAHKFDPKKHGVGGWWWSEKLDGERCFWDGGVSRGLLKNKVPWANTLKDERYNEEQVATGLWSRYGNVIHAPNWFLDSLPAIPLDGELYSRNLAKRQYIHSCIKKIVPVDDEWINITFMVFDSPSLLTILDNREIDTTNFKKKLIGCADWAFAQGIKFKYHALRSTPFCTAYKMLQENFEQNHYCTIHSQYVLPMPTSLAEAMIEDRLNKIVGAGGEGLIVRNPNAVYTTSRTHNMLKVKPFDDAEGTVTGYITGRQTDLGSKLLGKMGALILKLDHGARLELSGFTDEERRLQNREGIQSELYATDWAIKNAGVECPDWIESVHFPRGSRVTFKYWGLSADGIPQEARYWRQRI